VPRAITNMLGMRDRPVVTSSVIPSAKYCLSGSLLRLANGSTTIDRRGATKGCEIDVAVATSGAEECFVVGQSHHAPTPRASTAAVAATIETPRPCRRRDAEIGMLDAGRSAMAPGPSAWTRTGRAMF